MPDSMSGGTREGPSEDEFRNPGTTEPGPGDGVSNDRPAEAPEHEIELDATSSGESEYEPRDSRNVTGTADTPDGRWSGDPATSGKGSGEYEPRDSRNVTGTAATPDGRWTDDRDRLAPGDN